MLIVCTLYAVIALFIYDVFFTGNGSIRVALKFKKHPKYLFYVVKKILSFYINMTRLNFELFLVTVISRYI